VNWQTRDTDSIGTRQREWKKQRHRHYWDRTHNGQTRDTGKHWDKAQRMNKPEIQALLRQDTEWTNQRRMQYWDNTENGQTRDTCSIETRHIMDKPDTGSIGARHIMD
jgi:endo-alpha-1,4-polygalactosaminidase (GH114 family)